MDDIGDRVFNETIVRVDLDDLAFGTDFLLEKSDPIMEGHFARTIEH